MQASSCDSADEVPKNTDKVPQKMDSSMKSTADNSKVIIKSSENLTNISVKASSAYLPRIEVTEVTPKVLHCWL